jgi:ribonuclease G
VSEQILVNVTPREKRLAIVENARLQEVFVERASRKGLVGNIYLGKVGRVLPGMQAAFVDIGLEKMAFLHVSDVCLASLGLPENYEFKDQINKILQEGRSICVQVSKDPLGTKGARLTMELSIPSRFLVYMPTASNIGVSTRIDSEQERERLKKALLIATEETDLQGGFIARTLAEGVAEEELARDIRFLRKMWRSISEAGRVKQAPVLLHEDLALPLRALRDMVSESVESILVDSRETYQKMLDFSEKFVPELHSKIQMYKGHCPIFDLHSVEDDIQKAIERKVYLKSGGYLVIDQNEALTSIDINTGSFVGHSNLEETIFRTNLEATQVIARQLKLRNLGGIIVVDFIDMELEEHRLQVLKSLEESLAQDKAKTSMSALSKLGLVEITRQRSRESLEHLLCEECPVCNGRGSVKTSETITYDIFREITRYARQFPQAQKFLVMASDKVVYRIEDEESNSVAELETFIGKPVQFQAEPIYAVEQFDVVMM